MFPYNEVENYLRGIKGMLSTAPLKTDAGSFYANFWDSIKAHVATYGISAEEWRSFSELIDPVFSYGIKEEQKNIEDFVLHCLTAMDNSFSPDFAWESKYEILKWVKNKKSEFSEAKLLKFIDKALDSILMREDANSLLLEIYDLVSLEHCLNIRANFYDKKISALINGGRYEEAETLFSELENNKKEPIKYNRLKVLNEIVENLEKQGRYREAVECMDKSPNPMRLSIEKKKIYFIYLDNLLNAPADQYSKEQLVELIDLKKKLYSFLSGYEVNPASFEYIKNKRLDDLYRFFYEQIRAHLSCLSVCEEFVEATAVIKGLDSCEIFEFEKNEMAEIKQSYYLNWMEKHLQSAWKSTEPENVMKLFILARDLRDAAMKAGCKFIGDDSWFAASLTRYVYLVIQENQGAINKRAAGKSHDYLERLSGAVSTVKNVKSIVEDCIKKCRPFFGSDPVYVKQLNEVLALLKNYPDKTEINQLVAISDTLNPPIKYKQQKIGPVKSNRNLIGLSEKQKSKNDRDKIENPSRKSEDAAYGAKIDELIKETNYPGLYQQKVENSFVPSALLLPKENQEGYSELNYPELLFGIYKKLTPHASLIKTADSVQIDSNLASGQLQLGSTKVEPPSKVKPLESTSIDGLVFPEVPKNDEVEKEYKKILEEKDASIVEKEKPTKMQKKVPASLKM